MTRSEDEIAADPRIGDVYHTSWGYDQTNVEFFEVVARTPATVTLRRIAATARDGRVYPLPGRYLTDYLLMGNSGTARYERDATRGYSEKVCRTARGRWADPGRPGARLTIDDVRTAWPYGGGGEYETFAAGGIGH